MKQAILEMLNAGHRNNEWFSENLDFLKKDFNNKFVAISEQRVIESDGDLQELIKKLSNRNISLDKVMIEFVTKIKTIL